MYTRTLRLCAVGDVMLGSDYPSSRYLPPAGVNPLSDVAAVLRDANLTFANLEGPLTSGGATSKKGPRSFAFRSPPSNARRLSEAGIDVVSVANNHASDFGLAGRRSTRKALLQFGIVPVGAKGEVQGFVVGGTRVAVVAFAHSPASEHVSDLAAVRRLVGLAKGWGEIVIVSFHGGAEGSAAVRLPKGRETYLGEDRGDLRAFAHTAVESGASIVIGHGPHVPRAMELYKGHLVAYSLGNFATYGLFGLAGPTALAPILKVELDRSSGEFAGGKIISARQIGKGIPKLDPSDRAAKEISRLTQLDFPEGSLQISTDGTLSKS